MATRKTPFVPDAATVKLAEALADNGNSLVRRAPGVVYRINNTIPWDMSLEWHGRELAGYMERGSLWTKTQRVTFYGLSPTARHIHEFYVLLDNALTKEEVAQAAETYMMALNLRRVE